MLEQRHGAGEPLQLADSGKTRHKLAFICLEIEGFRGSKARGLKYLLYAEVMLMYTSLNQMAPKV